MQQILNAEFKFGSGYFAHVKIDQRTQRQRKLQRQPTKPGTHPYINAQYPDHPQNDGCQGKSHQPICGKIDSFGEPQLQGKGQPDKYRSQQGQVIEGNMGSVCIQFALSRQSPFQIDKMLIYSK